jgi:hypothetical protein
MALPIGPYGWRGTLGYHPKTGFTIIAYTSILHLQAVKSLSLASMDNSNLDLTWLDSLPSADDPKLHDCMAGTQRFVNTRVLIAEVFEWQGRHKEAIRCMRSPILLFIPAH